MSGIANFFFPKKQDEYHYTRFEDRIYSSETGRTFVFKQISELQKNGDPVSLAEVDIKAKVPHNVSVSRESHQVDGGNPEYPDHYEKVLITDTFTLESTDWKAAVLRVGMAACAILVVSVPFIAG